MADIPKLDYSKPPPQYVVEHDGPGGRWCWDSLDPRDGVETMGYAPGPGQDAALAAAWTHYKAHNDPPGMTIQWFWLNNGRGAGSWTASTAKYLVYERRHPRRGEGESEARAAAWTWYDAQLATTSSIDKTCSIPGIPDGYRPTHAELRPKVEALLVTPSKVRVTVIEALSLCDALDTAASRGVAIDLRCSCFLWPEETSVDLVTLVRLLVNAGGAP